MFFIAQLIYIKAGQAPVFDQFEDIAIPAILKYNGQLLLRIRLTENTFIESNIEKPYEIHLVEFATEHDFDTFMQYENPKRFLHVKDQSVKAVTLIKERNFESEKALATDLDITVMGLIEYETAMCLS